MSFDLGKAFYTLGVQVDTTKLKKGSSEVKATLLKIRQSALLALGVGGVSGLFIKAGRDAMDFAGKMADVSTLTDLSLKNMSKEIMSLSNLLGKPAQNADALYEAISAGVRGTEKELTRFTSLVSKLAITTKASQYDTMNAVTTIMNAYKLGTESIKDVSDSFFETIKLGKIRGAEYAQSIGMVVNTAAEAGIELDTMNAAIASLTRTMPASMAIISLNQAINAFLRPTKRATEIAAQFGIELSYQALKAKGFVKAIDEIKRKLGHNKDALSLMFGNIRAARAAFSLTGKQAKNFTRILGEFKNKAGEADRAFKKQSSSIAASYKAMEVAINKAFIVIGNQLAPFIRSFSDFVQVVSAGVQEFDNWGFVGSVILALLGKFSLSLIRGIMLTKEMATAIKTKVSAEKESLAVQEALAIAFAEMTSAIRANTETLLLNNDILLQTNRTILQTTSSTEHYAKAVTATTATVLDLNQALNVSSTSFVKAGVSSTTTTEAVKGTAKAFTAAGAASIAFSAFVWGSLIASFAEIAVGALKASGALDKLAKKMLSIDTEKVTQGNLKSSMKAVYAMTESMVSLGKMTQEEASKITDEVYRGSLASMDSLIKKYTDLTNKVEDYTTALYLLGKIDKKTADDFYKNGDKKKETLNEIIRLYDKLSDKEKKAGDYLRQHPEETIQDISRIKNAPLEKNRGFQKHYNDLKALLWDISKNKDKYKLQIANNKELKKTVDYLNQVKKEYKSFGAVGFGGSPLRDPSQFAISKTNRDILEKDADKLHKLVVTLFKKKVFSGFSLGKIVEQDIDKYQKEHINDVLETNKRKEEERKRQNDISSRRAQYQKEFEEHKKFEETVKRWKILEAMSTEDEKQKLRKARLQRELIERKKFIDTVSKISLDGFVSKEREDILNKTVAEANTYHQERQEYLNMLNGPTDEEKVRKGIEEVMKDWLDDLTRELDTKLLSTKHTSPDDPTKLSQKDRINRTLEDYKIKKQEYDAVKAKYEELKANGQESLTILQELSDLESDLNSIRDDAIAKNKEYIQSIKDANESIAEIGRSHLGDKAKEYEGAYSDSAKNTFAKAQEAVGVRNFDEVMSGFATALSKSDFYTDDGAKDMAFALLAEKSDPTVDELKEQTDILKDIKEKIEDNKELYGTVN